MKLYNKKGEVWDGEPIDAKLLLGSGMWFESPEPKVAEPETKQVTTTTFEPIIEEKPKPVRSRKTRGEK